MIFAILKNETVFSHEMWEKACIDRNIDYDIIDLTLNNWLEKIQEKKYKCYLACPSGTVSYFKSMYDEKIKILHDEMKCFIYPSLKEISIHENKRYLSYFLKANKLPHPATHVFYHKSEAIDFINRIRFPVIGKINIGASGKGVKVIHSKKNAIKYVNAAFSNKGIKQSAGPNLKMGDTKNRLIYAIQNPSHIMNRLKKYRSISKDRQMNFVIFQEYVPHHFEWRIVKIGDSYFGHQKIKIGEKASGTKGIDYVPPKEKLLSFVKEICEKFNFNSMAIDLFETGEGNFLINEMQTIFGHVQDYICSVDGKPGRFLCPEDKWIFEEGMFNTNLSYDLRMQNILQLLDKKL